MASTIGHTLIQFQIPQLIILAVSFFWERLLPHKIYLNFQSSAAAIQLLLGTFAELCVLDDLEGTGKENRIALGDYEGKTS